MLSQLLSSPIKHNELSKQSLPTVSPIENVIPTKISKPIKKQILDLDTKDDIKSSLHPSPINTPSQHPIDPSNGVSIALSPLEAIDNRNSSKLPKNIVNNDNNNINSNNNIKSSVGPSSSPQRLNVPIFKPKDIVSVDFSSKVDML